MKKNILILILIFATVITFIILAYSMGRRPAHHKSTTIKPVSQVLTVTGRVTGYNSSNSTITISTDAGSSVTIVSGKNTIIFKAKKYIKFTDIKIGDIITVNYESKKGVNIAKAIIVQKKKR